MGSEVNTNMRKGFTVIELLTVIAIIMIMLGVLRPMLSVSTSKSREYECESHLKQIGMAVHAYVEDYGAYPATFDSVDCILQDRNLMKCPATSEDYFYHAPEKAAPETCVIASCVKKGATGEWPHRFGDCCLSLSAAGDVQKVLK
jgi:prepilin-type N-terminal cleavage/methylation domain-containing protein